MLEEFRALGGVAENVTVGQGHLGRGLFPRDPAKPFRLRLPDNLLFPVSDTEFAGRRLRIKEDAEIAPAERAFFERYEHDFSWGRAGEAESAAFVSMLDSLPPEVRTTLTGDFGMGVLLQGDSTQRAQERFLESRMIYWHNRNVLMPLIELANCGDDAVFQGGNDGIPYGSDAEGRLQIEGETRGEILVNYGPHDPFHIFRTFGFPGARSRAYSLPITTRVGAMEVEIDWKTARRKKRGDVWVPEMTVKGDRIFLSYVMIGNANAPRLPRGMFCTLMNEAGATGADEAFDNILFANKGAFLHLLEVLGNHRGEMITIMTKMAHFQLEAMAHCWGTREL
jgi:hypothetical protein